MITTYSISIHTTYQDYNYCPVCLFQAVLCRAISNRTLQLLCQLLCCFDRKNTVHLISFFEPTLSYAHLNITHQISWCGRYIAVLNSFISDIINCFRIYATVCYDSIELVMLIGITIYNNTDLPNRVFVKFHQNKTV